MTFIKRMFRVGTLPTVLVGLMGLSLLGPVSNLRAQEGPPPTREGRDGPPREGRDGPPGGRPPRDRDGGPEGRDGPGRDGPGRDGPPGGRDGDREGPPPRGPGGPGGPGQGGPPRADYEQMRGYMELVDRYAKLAKDPSASGVAAVVAAGDTLRRQGPKAAAEFFEKILPNVKNETVARAIRIQLADLYRKAGFEDKALEQLSTIITSVPAGDSPKSAE